MVKRLGLARATEDVLSRIVVKAGWQPVALFLTEMVPTGSPRPLERSCRRVSATLGVQPEPERPTRPSLISHPVQEDDSQPTASSTALAEPSPGS